MKKLSKITILILSIGFISTPVLARQAVHDYVGYMRNTDSSAVHMRHERSEDDSTKQMRQIDAAKSAAELPHDSQNADDRESRRIGKLLWKSDYVQGTHSEQSNTRLLEWPSLWRLSHVQNKLDWPLLWKIAHVQGGYGTVN